MMDAEVNEIIKLLWWGVALTSATLVSVSVWFVKRLQEKVDDLPDQIAEKVDSLHGQLRSDTSAIRKSIGELERDVRSELTSLDRRVSRAEAFIQFAKGQNND